MSHEFRTPLSTSLMFLEGMIVNMKDPEQIRVITLVTTQLNLLLCLVNDVLDIKLIETGKFESKMERFSPLKILKFITDMFNP